MQHQRDNKSQRLSFFAKKGNVVDKWEQYIGIYEREFQRFRSLDRPVALLEVGGSEWRFVGVVERVLPKACSHRRHRHRSACQKTSRWHHRLLIEVHVADATDAEVVDTVLGGAVLLILLSMTARMFPVSLPSRHSKTCFLVYALVEFTLLRIYTAVTAYHTVEDTVDRMHRSNG